MNRPNLYIIGAPKCGTTSVAYWLERHKDVYLTDPKEPNYFSFDLSKPRPKSKAQYEKLYDQVKDEKVIAEASTRYLYSSVAIKHALKYSPKAKFIMLARNPVEMFYSLHNHLFQTGVESERSPKRAWELQKERKNSAVYRRKNLDFDSVMYGEICLLGEQVDRFFQIVPSQQRKVIVLDDLARDPETVFNDLLNFLSLEQISINFDVKNSSFKSQSRTLLRLIRLLSYLKNKVGSQTSFGILNSLSRFNRQPSKLKRESDEFNEYLASYFYEDVRKLSSLLGVDLMYWVESTKGLDK